LAALIPSVLGGFETLRGVAAADGGVLHAVGSSGALVRSVDGGLTWTQVRRGTSEPLDAIRGTGPRDLWAAGWWGTLLHSTDAGRTWVTVPTEVRGHL